MKIKVGNKIYDGDKDLVMIILTDKDKENIANMHKNCTKYCEFPPSTPQSVVDKFKAIKDSGNDTFYFLSYTLSVPGKITEHSSMVSYNVHPFEMLKNIAEDYFCLRQGADNQLWSFNLISWREITKEEFNLFDIQNFTEMTRRLRQGKAIAFEEGLKKKETNAQHSDTNGN